MHESRDLHRRPPSAIVGPSHMRRHALPDYAALDRYVEEHMPAWTDELTQFCRFSSESTDLSALRGAAEWIAERL